MAFPDTPDSDESGMRDHPPALPKGSMMIKLLSHLSYVEITSPDVEASVDFYVNQVGLTVVDRVDGAVYLRCWGDYYAYSVVVAPGDEPSLVTAAWRTSSPEALEEAAKRVEAAGIQGEWVDVHKIGRAYRFTGPYGHTLTLHWDVTRHHDTEGDAASIYPDRPSRRSKVAGAPRQLDHVTIATSDVDAFVQWYVDVLGENGYPIEYGPSIHGIGEQNFLYYREPSSLRIELNTGGYRNYVPDWEPNTSAAMRSSSRVSTQNA